MKSPRHFITLADVTIDELTEILRLAEEIKAEYQQGIRTRRLEGKVIALIFEKMSLRTRVSFEAGMSQLGGSSMLLEEQHIGLGSREPECDVG
ncbi:MAG: ornithine carbamoyltransferase, partial [Thermoguttaceae bacterium]|nr:ornithine carbamoyltransferase [Thermoguttaceae bacterium]